jgi:hypothetical protein
MIGCNALGVFVYIAFSSYPEVAVRLSQMLFIVEILLIPCLIFIIKGMVASRFVLIAFSFLSLTSTIYLTSYFDGAPV